MKTNSNVVMEGALERITDVMPTATVLMHLMRLDAPNQTVLFIPSFGTQRASLSTVQTQQHVFIPIGSVMDRMTVGIILMNKIAL